MPNVLTTVEDINALLLAVQPTIGIVGTLVTAIVTLARKSGVPTLDLETELAAYTQKGVEVQALIDSIRAGIVAKAAQAPPTS